MSRYIDVEKLLEENETVRCIGCPDVDDICANCWIATVMNFPAADVVSREVVEQIMWERDTAIQQLADYGIGFGEKADAVKVVRCKDCKLFQLDENIAPDLGTCNYVEMVRNIRDYCSRGEREEE